MSLQLIENEITKLLVKQQKINEDLEDLNNIKGYYDLLTWLDESTQAMSGDAWSVRIRTQDTGSNNAYYIDLSPLDAVEIVKTIASKAIEVAQRRRNGGDV
jgi:hypothetical protein